MAYFGVQNYVSHFKIKIWNKKGPLFCNRFGGCDEQLNLLTPLISGECILIWNNWSRLLAEPQGRDSQCWRGSKIGASNCFVPKQKSDGLSSLPHPSSSMHRLLLAEEMGRSREAKVRGVKIHPWRKPKPVVDPNQRLETAKQRNRETEALASSYILHNSILHL